LPVGVSIWLAYNPARTTIEKLKRAGYIAPLCGCNSVVERLLPKQDMQDPHSPFNLLYGAT